MSNHRAEAIVAGAFIAALAVLAGAAFASGFAYGKDAGRIELWQEQKNIIGIAEDEMITFPSGAVMYASGRIERLMEREEPNPYFQGQCVICHKNKQ
jgi:hypothetical protein